MTQKELLYFEDAILHECSIISICEETLNHLEDEKLVSFIENELHEHTVLKEKLMNLLEENSHE
jgi:hypothetical protein